MLLRELFEDGGKHITFCFGRFNPPTVGHKQLFDVMSEQGGDVKIFTSQSQDAKKNPLDYSTKIKFLKLIVPEYANIVVNDASLNTVVKVASHLYDQGYRDATFVAGSDRLEDMKKLLVAYNGVEGKGHGYYKFDVLDFASSGEREDGAEGVAGVSASSARSAAATGNLEKFAEATGAGQYAQALYDAVRKGMGINEGIEENKMKAKDFIPAEKPRNFVAKNAKMGGAGQHRDDKRAEKQGNVKHKKDLIPMEARDPEDWDEGNTEPSNNFAVYINGKKWKVFKGRGRFADDYKERDHYRQLQSWAQQKSEATGKKWTVTVTGEAPTA